MWATPKRSTNRKLPYRPQEAENKYYLTRWAELYFSRNRFTIERDQTASLYFPQQ